MDIVERVEGLIQEAKEDITLFFETAVESIAANGGSVLMGLVTDATAAAETTGASGPTKLAAVQTAVAEALVARGLPVVWNAINLAIHAVVAHMQAEAGQVPTDHAPKTDTAEIKPAADQNGTVVDTTAT